VQPVLEQEGDWHVEQATVRVVQRNQQDQATEVQEDAAPLG